MEKCLLQLLCGISIAGQGRLAGEWKFYIPGAKCTMALTNNNMYSDWDSHHFLWPVYYMLYIYIIYN